MIAATVPYRAKLAALLLDWDESQHPRDDAGKFTESGGGVAWKEKDHVDKTKFIWAEEGRKPDGGRIVVSNAGAQTITPKLLKQVVGDQDLSELASKIVTRIPGDLQVTWKVATVYGGKPALQMQVKRGDRLNIETTFQRESDGSLTVNHDKVELPKEAQGKGLAKDLMEDAFQTYQRMGAKRVDLYANLDQGGYAWAKFGFKSTNPGRMASRLDAILRHGEQKTVAEHMPALTPAQRSELIALVDKHKNDPKLPWHIAGTVLPDGQPVGKVLLNLSGWDATLKLDDAEAMDRLHRYATKKR